MDILDLFIQKNLLSKNAEKDVASVNNIVILFTSNDNLNYLSRIIYRELYLPNNSEKFNQIKLDVNKYAIEWSSSNEFIKVLQIDNSLSDLNEILRYINSLFIKKYKHILLPNSDFMTHEINNNPYKHIYNYKLTKKTNKDAMASDYDLISFNNYNDKYTTNYQFTKLYNKIPYYERALYVKNIDKYDSGSFRERKLVNNNYKLYNNYELMNNINYLK